MVPIKMHMASLEKKKKCLSTNVLSHNEKALDAGCLNKNGFKIKITQIHKGV